MPTQPEFERLVEDHQQMVFRTLARLTGRSQNLEDLAQDVFLRLFRALPAFRGESAVATYLYRITVNVAHNEWSRRRRDSQRNVSISEGESPWEDRLAHPSLGALAELESAEFAELLDAQLNRLSSPERSVLVLYHQEERTYEQISEILTLPINTVRTHLHRGRKKLREALLEAKVPLHAR